jgi:hypothetical protein
VLIKQLPAHLWLLTLTLISSNLSDCTTGSSAGLAPLRF